MCAICDVNEYRKCVKDLGSTLVVNLFDTLHALCNLLLVKHENLKQVCYGDTLVKLYIYSVYCKLPLNKMFIYYRWAWTDRY